MHPNKRPIVVAQCLRCRVGLLLAWIAAAGCHVVGLQAQESAPQASSQIDFKKQVAPILSEHCVECHNPQLEMAGLRLDTKESALASGAMDRGDGENSLLVQRLHDPKLGITMPPRRKLSDADMKTLREWIDQGADWPTDAILFKEDQTSESDSTTRALFAAIRSGKTRSVKRTLARSGSSDASRDPFGSTPLHHAAWIGSVSTLKHLLAEGADANAVNQFGITPLMLAIGNLKKTEMLLEAGADVHARSISGRTPLLLAASKSNNASVLTRLISAGAEVNVKDGRDWTPLIVAARTGDAKMLKLLLDAGATVDPGVDVKLSPGTPLTQASWAGDLVSVRLLLERETDKRAKSLDLALIFASTHGYQEIVDTLIEAGANANANEYTGYVPDTPLQAAAYSDHRPHEIVQCLIEHDAAIDVAGRKGETAAAYAAMRGDARIATLLGNPSGVVSGNKLASSGAAGGVEQSRRETIAKSLALLQSCDSGFFNASGCVACHQQSASSLTTTLALDRGFSMDASAMAQRQKLMAFELENLVSSFMQRHKIGGTAHRIGYILWGLAASGYAPDMITDAAVCEVSGLQLKNGSWVSDAHRPPTEYSPFSATAVSVRALQDYGPPGLKRQYEQQVRRARRWLETAVPREQQELAFRLLGLKWAHSSADILGEASRQLLELQNADGGWAQLPDLPSDAYATGLSLYALHIGGGIAADTPAYERGIAFLLRTQEQPGAWHVTSRSYRFQPYFESGFPFEHDQWISSAATGWATMALLFAVEKQ